MGIVDFAVSVLGGAGAGIIGSIITRVGDYFQHKQEIEKLKMKYDSELALRHVDERIMELEWQGRDKVAITEGQSAVDVADSRAFEASYSLEPKMYSNNAKLSKFWNGYLAFFDGLRAAVRPGITAILTLLLAVVFWYAAQFIKDANITADQAFEIYNQIATHILFLNTCCVTWWFGSQIKNKEKK